ncbi:MAG: sigma-54 dependent transcriptional regulator [Gammaproteobacteria bacterium]|nr:sigma-54 dependent transcriptional regulator [Gammaproteobacteria bacterium]MDH4256323.1 sigma-54 dependent transcriptional regulator [Gammaproteobacteria bacterium]MDH5311107.1 sigma-54 dependent transcriptional regulator [Gammaproteobacteria bacterium]
MNDHPMVLVVDELPAELDALRAALEPDFRVRTAHAAADARRILAEEWVHVLVCDEQGSGAELLAGLPTEWPDIVSISLTTNGTGEHSGDTLRLQKPWEPDTLVQAVQNGARMYKLQRENELLALELKMSRRNGRARRRSGSAEVLHDDGIVRGRQSPMNDVCLNLAQVAPYDVSVLLTGESGTGKELAARALHSRSLRWNKPFVVENCGALPDDLLESELFGHKKGAFTGAVNDHVGLFSRADGGTVFLDEIGEVSPAFQVKLLRVLQDGEVRPVGGNATHSVDVRIVAATNRDLGDEVRAGRFRDDLYYRLATVVVELPPLRKRRDDIPLLVEFLFEQGEKKLGKKVPGITEETIDCLCRYHWPGNVRELQNEIRRMLVMAPAGEPVSADLLAPHILRAADPCDACESIPEIADSGTLKDRVASLEARVLRETLIRHHWNKSRAARELGLSRVGLRNKLERYGLARTPHADELRVSRQEYVR